MSKRKEEKLNKSQLSTFHKNKIKENTKYNKHKRRCRNIIDKRNYYLSLIFLILLNIFGQVLHHSQFLRKINYYSYVTLKIKGIGNRKVLNGNQGDFPSSSYPDEVYINGNKQVIDMILTRPIMMLNSSGILMYQILDICSLDALI